MKQFNLEEYLKNPSRKVVTREGRNARIICTDAKGLCPIVGLVDYGKYEVAFNATKDGRFDGISDLFFAPEKHEGWVNVIGLKRGEMYCGFVHDSEEEAIRKGGETAIATVKIEWEE